MTVYSKSQLVAKPLALFVGLALWTSGVVYAGQTKSTDSSSPIWSADVIQDLGPNRTAPFMEDRDRAGVIFLDSRQLVVHEVDLDTSQLSSRRSADVSSPFRLRVSVLDSSSGRSILAREWGTRVRHSSVLVSWGGILLRTGETLRLLSKDFVELESMPIPHPNPGEEWEMRVSASRKSVLLNYYKQDWKERVNFSRFTVLDGKTFEVRQTWTETPALHNTLYSISDTAMATDEHLHTPEHIFISPFGKNRWEPIWQKSERSCAGPAVLTFVTDNSFVYACKEFSFVSGGQVLMKQTFDKGQRPVAGKVSVTEDGKHVAISLQRVKGGFFDTEQHTSSTRVVVYDLSSMVQVLTVNVHPLPKNDYDFALSPDGSKLAVLNDQRLSVYSVPVQWARE